MKLFFAKISTFTAAEWNMKKMLKSIFNSLLFIYFKKLMHLVREIWKYN